MADKKKKTEKSATEILNEQKVAAQKAKGDAFAEGGKVKKPRVKVNPDFTPIKTTGEKDKYDADGNIIKKD